MNQFHYTPTLLSSDTVEMTANTGAVGRILVVILLTVTLALAARSLRLIWGPISEIVGLLLRAGAIALFALTMLVVVVVLTIAYV